MDGYKAEKIYEQMKIPERTVLRGDSESPLPQKESTPPAMQREGLFYEIEYDAGPIPGVGKFVLKPQKVEQPESDEIRNVFREMKEIAKSYRSALDYSRFYDKNVLHNSARIFYKQGLFMKDFTDEYDHRSPLKTYYPCYQMMGYDQLRTYFTWRTEVRKGNVTDTSLSYAFLYIYELLNNIGVEDPQDGLDKLMTFWRAFGVYNKGVDRYLPEWLKDYHIYYELPLSFQEFVERNDLAGHYPRMTNDSFELFCAASRYDPRKSAFFTGDRARMFRECFLFVADRLRQICSDNNIRFDDAVFEPTKKVSEWTPFRGALFCQSGKQKDRRVVLSENEIYLCRRNQWVFSKVISSESGRQLIGYVMKHTESVLRKTVKYKHKLSADINTVSHPLIIKLTEIGLPLDKLINGVVAEFYREASKTVVRVDREALSKIRLEALAIQEKLIVPEQDEPFAPGMQQRDIPQVVDVAGDTEGDTERDIEKDTDLTVITAPAMLPVTVPDSWMRFIRALTPTEEKALSELLRGEMGIKDYAYECGIMPEVIADGINEKAMDHIGDNIMDEAFAVYDDYRDQLEELIG